MVIMGVETSNSANAAAYVTGIVGVGIVVFAILIFINRKYFFANNTRTENTVCDEIIYTSRIQNNGKSRALERMYSFDIAECSEELEDILSCSSQMNPSPSHKDIERGGETTLIETRLDTVYSSNPNDSIIKETHIDNVETSSLDQSARMVAYRQLAQIQSSVESDATNQDYSIISQDGLPSLDSYGTIEVAFLYDAPMRKMTIHVLQARDLPQKDRGQSNHTQIRLIMLPSKKQKHKTKIRSGDNPQFMESFLLHKVNPEEVNSMGVRFRVYGCERMRRQRMIGEVTVQFSSLKLELENSLWLTLQPRASIQISGSTCDLASIGRSDSVSSCSSMQHGGVAEMLIGLAYNGTTGSLSVEVIKGSHFRKLSINKAPDTYVKLCLVSSLGQEMGRSKTTTRRGQPNPLYKELFMFQVALFQLSEVTLMISVWWRRSVKKNEMVGWFSLGLNSSGQEEAKHWKEMREAKGEQIQRWHILIDS